MAEDKPVEAKESKTTNGKPQTKTDFIRSLPLDMSVAEVVEKAKGAGFEVTPKYVHKTRVPMRKAATASSKAAGSKASKGASKSSASKMAKKGSSTKAKGSKSSKAAKGSKTAGVRDGKKATQASKKATSPKGKPSMTKAQFVRKLPASMPTSTVIAEGSKLGLALSAAYVAKIRRKARPKGTNKPASRPAAKPFQVMGKSADAQFRKLVLQLGLQRSRELLGQVERKLDELIAGK